MSRSYRKHFWFPIEGDKRNKKYYNRKVRRCKDVDSGAAYKKMNESWEIKSFFFFYKNEDDFVRENLPFGDDTEQDLRNTFRKHFRSK